MQDYTIAITHKWQQTVPKLASYLISLPVVVIYAIMLIIANRPFRLSQWNAVVALW